MHHEPLKQIYQKIDALLLSFPLAEPSAYGQIKRTAVPAPATEDYLLWALAFLELPAGSQAPFCTSAQAARDEALERFLHSARTLNEEMAQLIREISADLPGLAPLLDNTAEHCAAYAEQARLAGRKGEISLADFRRLFRSYLSVIIQNCCGLLFGQEHPLAGAALLAPIRTHLEQIGVSTPPHSGLQFDYDNYEPYFTRETPDPALDEHFESILLPAYLLGRSKVHQGLASCYLYKPKEDNSDAVRTVTE